MHSRQYASFICARNKTLIDYIMEDQMKITKHIFILFITVQSINGFHFGYSKRDQHHWVQESKSCAGKMQSPIPLSTSKAIALPLPALEMVGYHNIMARPLLLENNGHSVSLKIQKDLAAGRLPYIFGAVLASNHEYELEGLHFHWGAKNNRGSEHVLNGVRFPMEMHIIHRNTIYPNIADALKHEDGLTVLGIFFQLQEEDNEQLHPIINSLPDVQWVDTKTPINVSVILASLLPQNTDTFYTYKGSLTTPPCSEAVTWIIFPSTVSISYRQMNKFRTLSNGEGILADNYRGLQQIGLRKIYVRRLDISKKLDTTHTNVSSLNWFWE